MGIERLFDNDEYINLKWKKNIKFENKITYKNSLVENSIKYPLTESIIDKESETKWKKILDIENMSIDNINNIIDKYDKATKNVLNNENKKGYFFNEEEIVIMYNNDLVTQIEKDNDQFYLNSTILNIEELELVPIFYTMNYNMYNLFSLNSREPITYYDDKLKEKVETIINKKNLNDTMLAFSKSDNNIIKKLINHYYKDTVLNEDLEKLLNTYEMKLDSIVKHRKLFQKEINNELKKIDEIRNNKVLKITLMQKLEFLQMEIQKIALIENTELKEKSIKKLIKNNGDVFKDCQDNDYVGYINDLINDEYMELYVSPSEHKENLEMLYNNMKNDIVTTYLIAIYYYLIMIIIKKSDNTLSSKYEGNLIKKAIFNIEELEDFIEFINRNLLI